MLVLHPLGKDERDERDERDDVDATTDENRHMFPILLHVDGCIIGG